MRRRFAQTRPPLLAQGSSLSALPDVDGTLRPGSAFVVELDLGQPVAWAFDAAGAEGLFQGFVPDGLTLVDVRGEGSSRGVIEMRVNDNAEAGQTAHMGVAVAVVLAAVLAFIRVNWLSIIVAGFVLSTLVTTVSVFGSVAGGGEGLGVVLLIGLVAFGVAQTQSRSRRNG